ncbi:MAG: response regulator [Spirochaetes bacterium]|nr:response regulator [Spirochaetota bacterium]
MMKKHPYFKIFLLDNDEEFQQILKKSCKKIMVRIDKDINEKAALKRIVSSEYDHYFINVDIPELNGRMVIRFINNIKDDPRIIAVTSGKGRETEGMVRSLGITYYLRKPVSMMELKSLILKGEPELVIKNER